MPDRTKRKSGTSESVVIAKSGPVRARYQWQSSLEKAKGVPSRDPRKYPWGYYSRDDYAGVFFWFGSLHELLTYIATIEPVVCSDWELDNPQVEPMRARLKVILDRTFARKRIKLTELLNELQAAVAGDASLLWIGTFQDLCHAKGKFAADLVGEFLDEQDEPQIVPPVKIPEFIEFIGEYGL
jgi:hypothetical protein